MKTPFGLTKRIEVEEVVQQRGSWGPIMCSNTVDSVTIKSKGKYNYKYKESTEVPNLAFIDDNINISKCGLEAVNQHIYFTKMMQMKRVNFNVGDKEKKSKCEQMHVGKKTDSCPSLQIDGNSLEIVSKISYLGDVVSNNGKNVSNIKERISRGIGIINNIFSILENMNFGKHYFEIALLLFESLLINGILYNSEVWYNLTKKNIQDLSIIDKIFFSRLFSLPRTALSESVYLELGICDVENIIKIRRVMYFYNIINRNKKHLVFRVIMAQYNKRAKGDWIIDVLKDINDLKIKTDFEFRRSLSKASFKKIVKSQMNLFALKKFQDQQKNHSKMKNLEYNCLKIQKYFLENTKKEDKVTIFKSIRNLEEISELVESLLCVLFVKLMKTVKRKVLIVKLSRIR